MKFATINDRWTLLFIGLGYLGAAVFYSYLVGINENRQIYCLVCPHIFSISPPAPPPTTLFIQRTIAFGSLNAFFVLVVGWTIIFLVKATKWVIRKARA
jgi:hypothetical protein